jgi:hypothetical protein
MVSIVPFLRLEWPLLGQLAARTGRSWNSTVRSFSSKWQTTMPRGRAIRHSRVPNHFPHPDIQTFTNPFQCRELKILLIALTSPPPPPNDLRCICPGSPPGNPPPRRDVTVGKNFQHGFDRIAVCYTIAPLNLPKQSPAGAQRRVRIARNTAVYNSPRSQRSIPQRNTVDLHFSESLRVNSK